MSFKKQSLWTNVNRLAMITGLFVLLKTFTYFVQDFLPVFGMAVNKLFSAFLPFIIAVIIAFLLEPLLEGVMRFLKIRRPYAAVLALLLAFAGTGVFVLIIVARLYTELSELAISIPNYGYFVDFIMKQINNAEKLVEVNPQIQETFLSAIQSMASTLQSWAKAASGMLLSFLTALPRVFIIIVVSIVATILISSSYPDVKLYVSNLFPRRFRSGARAVSEQLGAAIVGFVRSQAILVSITSFGTICGLLLMGNRYAVTFGVIAGLLDLFPIIGTGMLFVPWALGLFIMGSFGEGLKLLIMWIAIMVVRQFLEPKVMSKGIGINPLPTLISMYVGLQLLGGIGLVVGPAVVICYEAVRRVSALGPPKE